MKFSKSDIGNGFLCPILWNDFHGISKVEMRGEGSKQTLYLPTHLPKGSKQTLYLPTHLLKGSKQILNLPTYLNEIWETNKSYLGCEICTCGRESIGPI